MMLNITALLSVYVVLGSIQLSIAAIYTYEDIELRRIFPAEFPQDTIRKSGSVDPEHLGRYDELKHYFKYPKTRLNSHFEELACFVEGGKKICRQYRIFEEDRQNETLRQVEVKIEERNKNVQNTTTTKYVKLNRKIIEVNENLLNMTKYYHGFNAIKNPGFKILFTNNETTQTQLGKNKELISANATNKTDQHEGNTKSETTDMTIRNNYFHNNGIRDKHIIFLTNGTSKLYYSNVTNKERKRIKIELSNLSGPLLRSIQKNNNFNQSQVLTPSEIHLDVLFSPLHEINNENRDKEQNPKVMVRVNSEATDISVNDKGNKIVSTTQVPTTGIDNKEDFVKIRIQHLRKPSAHNFSALVESNSSNIETRRTQIKQGKKILRLNENEESIDRCNRIKSSSADCADDSNEDVGSGTQESQNDSSLQKSKEEISVSEITQSENSDSE